MWLFYFLIFMTLSFAVAIPKNNYKSSKRYLFLVFAAIGCLIMFRSVNVGNDTDEYIDLFNSIAKTKNLTLYIERSRFEPGYIYLNWYLSKISTNPQILFMVTGFFTAISFKRFIYHYSEIPWMSFFMFMTLQFFDLTLTGVRQILAIAFLLYAYDFLVKRKLIRFIGLVFLAYTIHTSAIMFLLLYPLTNRLRSKKFYIISASVSIGVYIMFSYVLTILHRVFPRYVVYFTEDGDSYSSSATLAVVLMLILWILMFLIANISKFNHVSKVIRIDNNSNPKDKRMWVKHPHMVENVLQISIWLSVLMLFMALKGTILNRFKYVFSAAMLVYYPNSLKKISNDSNKNLMILGSCIVFFIYILVIYILRPEWQSTYPYSFYWE